jgi:UDP-N-acetylmuramate dehydrogenase
MIQQHISLRPFNTFGLEAEALYFTELYSRDDLLRLLPITEPLLILGGGSNILLTQNWQGLVLKNSIKGIHITHETATHTEVAVGGGEVWHDFVRWAIAQNLGGVENMSLIPGTVGAAPIQNIGAYGAELKDVFVRLEAVRLADGAVQIFDKAQCGFGYRESVFKKTLKGQYLITQVTLRLQKNPTVFNTSYGDIKATLTAQSITQPTLRDISDAVITIRRSKLPDPAELGNSGSFFKNPAIPLTQYTQLCAKHPTLPSYPTTDPNTVKIPAGWLIEQAGWKGKRVGNTGSHARQALVLVNYGGATGAEVYQLALDIIADVQAKFEITLAAEVNVI